MRVDGHILPVGAGLCESFAQINGEAIHGPTQRQHAAPSC